MDIAALTITASRLWGGEDLSGAPCRFIDLRDLEPGLRDMVLPPCPVIVIGKGGEGGKGGSAAFADAVVPDELAANVLLQNISANPQAAAVIVQLLRLLPDLSLDQGLVAESFAYGLLQGSAEHTRWLAGNSGKAALSKAGNIITTRDNDRLHIVMDRGHADNAIDQPMRDGLAEALRMAVLDRSITRVTLRGLGRSFSLGADLAEFGTTRDPATAHMIRSQTLPAHWAARCADRLEAHVQGACVGAGLELAAFAYRLTAGPRAWFQLPELAMGLLPGAGGCVSLTRRIGRQRTAELILSGQRLSARQALDWGLVDALVDDGAADQGGVDQS